MRLASDFLERLAAEAGRSPMRFSADAAAAIRAHRWPGNVRELKNAVERAVVLSVGEEVQPGDLGLSISADEASSGNDDSALVSLATAERRHINRVLDAVDGNKTQACKILKIGRGTLYNKLADEG